MHNVYVNDLKGGMVKVKIIISTLLTWTFKYDGAKAEKPIERSSSNYNPNELHELGKPEDLKTFSDSFDMELDSSDGTARDYEVTMEWWHFPADGGAATKLKNDWKQRKEKVKEDTIKLDIYYR